MTGYKSVSTPEVGSRVVAVLVSLMVALSMGMGGVAATEDDTTAIEIHGVDTVDAEPVPYDITYEIGEDEQYDEVNLTQLDVGGTDVVAGDMYDVTVTIEDADATVIAEETLTVEAGAPADHTVAIEDDRYDAPEDHTLTVDSADAAVEDISADGLTIDGNVLDATDEEEEADGLLDGLFNSMSNGFDILTFGVFADDDPMATLEAGDVFEFQDDEPFVADGEMSDLALEISNHDEVDTVDVNVVSVSEGDDLDQTITVDVQDSEEVIEVDTIEGEEYEFEILTDENADYDVELENVGMFDEFDAFEDDGGLFDPVFDLLGLGGE